MTWYRPRTWTLFGPSPEELSRITLYCANPQCSDPIIRESRMGYDEERQELYHPGECQLYALAHRTWREATETGVPSVVMGNFEFVDRRRAQRLAHRGKIKPREGLESKL